MKKKAILSFYKRDNKLELSIVIGYDDFGSAQRCAKEIKTKLYYYSDNNEYELLGDYYTNNG